MKNIVLYRKLGKNIRGNNLEANLSIAYFMLFIAASLAISTIEPSFGQVILIDNTLAIAAGVILLVLNLVIAGASLIGLKDSWRVGVIENQRTDLILTGIYKFSRNPYFLAYLLMFVSYTLILQNAILFVLSLGAVLFIDRMIKKEETYLLSVHGDLYLDYKKTTPRYFIK